VEKINIQPADKASKPLLGNKMSKKRAARLIEKLPVAVTQPVCDLEIIKQNAFVVLGAER